MNTKETADTEEWDGGSPSNISPRADGNNKGEQPVAKPAAASTGVSEPSNTERQHQQQILAEARQNSEGALKMLQEAEREQLDQIIAKETALLVNM